MNDSEWAQDFARSLGVYLAGDALDETDHRGQPVHDDSFLLLLNGASRAAFRSRCPQFRPGVAWQVLVDTGY